MITHFLLPDSKQLRLDWIDVKDQTLHLAVSLISPHSVCPDCGQESKRIHSRYIRKPADLPCSGIRVQLHLNTRRFFCDHSACPRRTFTERLPQIIASFARRTKRLIEVQQAIGFSDGGEAGARLTAKLGMPTSPDTLLRMIKAAPELNTPSPRVLGVDDWAIRKGQTYGTILVDLETHQPVDLLPDRTSDSLEKWLKAHPGVEIISRDRSQEYAKGANSGAPQAIQVADRWHLLKNLSDTVFKVLQQEHRLIQQRLSQLEKSDEIQQLSDAPRSVANESLTLAEQRRSDRIQQAHEYHQLGWTQKAIARKLNLHPKTVRRYLSGFSPRARRRRTGKPLLADYKPYLLKRWNEGAHNAAGLYREIREQGYAGETTMVRLFVMQLRQASSCQQGESSPVIDATIQIPSLRSLTWLIVKRAADRSEEAEQVLAEIISDHTKLLTTVNLAREFAEMVREQKVAELDPWLEKADRCGLRSWKNFSSKLRQDYDAVLAALTLPWSNGITEGHVNRLKAIKREMYGRANFDLLRKRVLQLSTAL